MSMAFRTEVIFERIVCSSEHEMAGQNQTPLAIAGKQIWNPCWESFAIYFLLEFLHIQITGRESAQKKNTIKRNPKF